MVKKKKFWKCWGTWVGIATTTLALITAIMEFPKKFQENFLLLAPKEKLDGIVNDTAGNPLAGAVVKIDLLPSVSETTSTSGGFIFKDVPGKPGDLVRVSTTGPGYKRRDQYFPLPGPARIIMEKQ